MTQAEGDRPGGARRKALGGVVTAILMVVVVVVALRRGTQMESVKGGEPSESVAALIDAAERGDVAAYLACFTGELREQLEAKAAASRPPERFRESLQAAIADLKGSVTSEVEHTGASEAVLLWERVYAKYNERYRVRLRLLGDEWKIFALERIDRGPPPIPYGTPVFPTTPEPPGEEGTQSSESGVQEPTVTGEAPGK